MQGVDEQLGLTPGVGHEGGSVEVGADPSRNLTLLATSEPRILVLWSSIFPDILPVLAVIVLPDHIGERVGAKGVVSIVPHPVIFESIGIKDDIVVGWMLIL